MSALYLQGLLLVAISICTIHGLSESPTKEIKTPVSFHNQCRVSGGKRWDPETFALVTCATCYFHLDDSLFLNGTKLLVHHIWLINPETKQTYEARITNSSSSIFESFSSEKTKKLWVGCCQAAVQCCLTMRKAPAPKPGQLLCPRTWDGWDCWPDALNGTTVESLCPSHIYFHSEEPECQRYAFKACLENGTWYQSPYGEYTNYSTCGRTEDIKAVINTHVITFGISIILLVPALIIFFYYRQLQVYRVFMHKNLFISLLLTAIFVVIFEADMMYDSVTKAGDSILVANKASCKVLYTVTKYFRLSTYTWMFCEGLYLHKLIVEAFAEQKNILLYHAIGWGFPIIPVVIWAILRKTTADYHCWTVPTRYIEWVMFAPMLLALAINFCFLAHIIQVIVTKLKSSNADEPAQFRRAVRATLVLIPLFGLHFLLFIYHPTKGSCKVLHIYNIVMYVTDGLQGGLVSLIFCYFNHEVLYLLKRTYHRRKMIHSVGSHANSKRTARSSRGSLSTNAESLGHEVAANGKRYSSSSSSK